MTAADDTTPVGTPPPSRRRQLIVTAVGVIALAALAYALARNWSKVSQYDWQLRPGWLIAGVGLVLAGYLWNGLAYVRSVEWLSREHPPRRVALSIWARSLIARYIPGNVMMVIGRAVLNQDHGVPRKVTLAATVYEQALALGLGTLGAVAYLAAYGNPGDPRLLLLLLVVPVVLACLHPRPFRRLSSWALRKLGRPPLETLFSERQVLRLMAMYALGIAPLCVGVWALVRSAAGADAGGPFEVGLAFLLAFVISFLAFILPSGIGVRDGILALAFSRHLPGGVALAISVGLRFALIVIELMFVGLATVAGRRR